MPSTTINPDDDVMTLVNIFRVEPKRCDDLVRLLIEATDRIMHHLDGFVAANIYRSFDGTRVINYAQWSSREASPRCWEIRTRASTWPRQLALAEGFEPTLCSVVETVVRP